MAVSTRTSDELRALLAEVDPAQELPVCGLQELVLGSGCIDSVSDTVARLLEGSTSETTGSRPVVCVLVDSTPIRRLGQDLKELVVRRLGERYDVRRAVLDDGAPELHVTEDIVAEAARACEGADAVVAVGGGTISDIGKLAALGASGDRRPVLVSVQTAASVDGYTDDVSVVLRDGVKRTVPSRWPDAVIADAETIAEAPATMNRAGFGEMTSMLVAPADWRLANLLGVDDTFHHGPIRLLTAVGADIDEWSAGVRAGDPDGVAGLTRALAFRGVATGVAGTTAVLSGVEHLVSHMLDQHHAQHHQPMGLHGAQVGVASVVAASAWEMLLDRMATSSPRLVDEALDADNVRDRVERAFVGLDPTGRLAQECWKDYARKLEKVVEARSRIGEVLASWPDHVSDLGELVRSSRHIAAGLDAAGAAATFDELDPCIGPELARWAVAHCALMRNRFTVVDLLTILGWWTDADVDEVFARADAAVASTRRESPR